MREAHKCGKTKFKKKMILQTNLKNRKKKKEKNQNHPPSSIKATDRNKDIPGDVEKIRDIANLGI